MPQNFTYSDIGLALTRQFEGLRLDAYRDSAGVWTIGYGHTGPDVTPGRAISETEADELLRGDVAKAVACVNRVVTAVIQQNHFDALVDFCYNAGAGAFTTSTLLRDLNEGQFEAAAGQFGLWVHAGGRVAQGLVKRRAAEAEMFQGTSSGVALP